MKVRFGFFNKINDIPLKFKFILIYVVCVLIPIITFNLLFLGKISALVEARETENFRIAMERAQNDIVGIIKNSIAVSHFIATDRYLGQALERKYRNFEDYYDVYDSYLRDRLYRYVSVYNSIQQIRLYTTNKTVGESGYYLYINDEVKNKSWYKTMAASGKGIVLHAFREQLPSITTASDQNICVVEKMNGGTSSNSVWNYVKIDIDMYKIFEIFNREQNLISIFLVDDANRMIYAPNNDLFFQMALKTPDFNPEIFGKHAVIIQNQLGAANYFKGWRIVGVTDSRIVFRALNSYYYFMVSLVIVSVLVATLLLLVIGRSYNDRIQKLARQMVKVENQQFEPIELAAGKDEIGGLIKSFNLMTAKINSLINDVYKLNLQKKGLELERVRAELNFLQSQMNPHFLFNTLNAIMVVCVKNNYLEISEVIKYLAKTLRRLLSWKDDLVTVAEEIAFTEMYLKIEKFRFGEKFQYELTIDEKTLSCRIPKMSVQPLIENACVHGIQTLKEDGLIRVRIGFRDDMLWVSVSDNGSGIDGETLAQINRTMSDEHVSSPRIGILNVYRRLKLYYGAEVKFDIVSQVNQGTEVSFAIPVEKLGAFDEGGGFDSLCTG